MTGSAGRNRNRSRRKERPKRLKRRSWKKKDREERREITGLKQERKVGTRLQWPEEEGKGDIQVEGASQVSSFCRRERIKKRSIPIWRPLNNKSNVSKAQQHLVLFYVLVTQRALTNQITRVTDSAIPRVQSPRSLAPGWSRGA